MAESEDSQRTAAARPGEAPEGAHVELHDVVLAYGARRIFDGLSCAFPRGKVSVILGGSGVGKSTLLKLVGGLVRAQSGRLLVDGVDLAGASEARLAQARRGIGMMFQNGALLNSLSVFENLAFPLREHERLTDEQLGQRVAATLADVGLPGVEELLPGQLSGGMTKRVALARALMRRPSLLLCDEPFSGLDPVSTRRIERLLQGINRRHGMSIVVVSHDVPSTLRLADHVVLILPGAVFQGPPRELSRHADRRVAAYFAAADPAAVEELADEAEAVEAGPGGAPR